VTDVGDDGLFRTCLHEYAHLAVARHFGACGFVTVRAVPGAAAGFAGRLQMFGELGDAEWRVVALAGALAEFHDDDPTLGTDAARLRLVADPELLCGVDAELAQGFGADDVRRCLEILRVHWTSIEGDAIAHGAPQRSVDNEP
jgi:hypothetical protein